MAKRLIWLLLSCLLVLALVLPACKAAEPTTTPSTTPTTSPTTTPTTKPTTTPTTTPTTKPVTTPTTAPTTQPAAVEPTYGGTLTIIQQYGTPPGWDMARLSPIICMWVGFSYEQAYAGDIDKYGPRGDKSFAFGIDYLKPSWTFKGALCESWEMTDAQTIVWHVRKGVHWQNKAPTFGRELDSQDFVVAWTRLLNTPRFSTGEWSFIKDIEAIDKYTFKWNLKSFSSWWLYFQMKYSNMYPRELVEQNVANDWRYVCGTGPFMLTDYVSDVAGTFAKNPDYWDTTPINGKQYKIPFVDKLNVLIVPDQGSRLAAMRSGKLDLLWMQTATDVTDLQKTRPELVTHEAALTNAQSIFMRVDKGPPLDNIKVRRALWMAINYQDLLNKLNMGKGIIEDYTWMVAPGWGYQKTPKAELPPELVETYTYNPTKAKQLLTEAGYPQGFKTELLVTSSSYDVDMASLVASYWKAIGVTLDIRTESTTNQQTISYAGGYNAMTWFRIGEPPLSAAVALTPGHSLNFAKDNDPVFEKMYKDALVERDPKKLDDAIKAMDLYHALKYTAHKVIIPNVLGVNWPWAKNWYGEVDVGYEQFGPPMARIWIDQALKKKMGY